MTIHVSHATLWVRDQEEALTFFQKIGFDVKEDVRNGDFRWLSVSSPTQPDIAIVLMKPGFPLDDSTAATISELVAKGMLSTIVFTTDDCFADYEDLKSKGVEFTRPAENRGYAIDASFRDPSGNEFRLVQTAKQPA